MAGSQYSVNQQFPKEIQARRKELVPTLKRLKDEGERAYLSIDKLYVNKLYTGDLVAPDQQQNGSGSNGFGRGRGRGRGRGFGQGRGRGQGWGQGQSWGHDQSLGNMQAGGNAQSQGTEEANRFDVLLDESEGQVDAEEGQGQG